METVQELVEAFREDEKDAVAPYFWSDAQLVRWARQAVDRFCEITRSVYDSTSSFTTIDVRAGDDVFPRHASIIDIVSARIEGPNGRALDILAPGQRPASSLPSCGMTKAVVVDDSTLRIHPPAPHDFTLRLEVVRRPIRRLELQSKLTDVPVSAREDLLLFLKHRAYRVSDAEIFDPSKAADYLAEFEQACQRHYEVAHRARRSGAIRFRW